MFSYNIELKAEVLLHQDDIIPIVEKLAPLTIMDREQTVADIAKRISHFKYVDTAKPMSHGGIDIELSFCTENESEAKDSMTSFHQDLISLFRMLDTVTDFLVSLNEKDIVAEHQQRKPRGFS